MRIAFLSTWHPLCGIATYTEQLAEALVARGHKVALLVESGAKPSEMRNLPVEISWSRRDADSLGRVAEFLAEHPADVVHVQHEFGLFPWTSDVICFLDRVKEIGVRSVVTLHTIRPGHEDERTIASRADAVIAHSMAGMDCIAQRGQVGRVVKIPHGTLVAERARPTQARELLGIPLDAFVVASLGFLSPNKRLEETGAALLRALPRIPKLRWICGGAPVLPGYAEQVAAWIEQRQNLRTRTTLLREWQSPQQLAAILAASDVAVLNAPDTFFSSSGQLHLAIAHGTPVLAADRALYHEAQVCGLTFHPDGSDLPAKLQELSKNPGDCRRLRVRALNYARKTAWPVVAGWHEALYMQTCASGDPVSAIDQDGTTLAQESS